MNIDFSQIVAAQAIVAQEKQHRAFSLKNLKNASQNDSKPLVQMSAFPISLEIDKYINPFSSTNPTGSYLNAYSFRDLVNHVPKFTKYYSPGSNTIESIYSDLLNGYQTLENFPFVTSAFYRAKQIFDNSKLATMDGIPTNWWLVNGLPNNWATKIQNPDSLLEIVIDMNDIPNSFNNKFNIIDGNNSVELKIKDKTSNSIELKKLSNDSSLEKIRFKYIWVTLTRDWLNTELFAMNNWYINGLPIGYYSSGKADSNNGVMPLLPTSLLIGTDVEIIASISNKDLSFIQNGLQKSREVSIDMFPVNTINHINNKNVLTYKDVSVMGYINELIPIAPKMKKN